jgi:hypothetical protein
MMANRPLTAGEAGVRHGYTMAGIDSLAWAAMWKRRKWWAGYSDWQNLHEAAWSGIAEYLCAAREPPPARDLMIAAWQALATEIHDDLRHHGTRKDERRRNNGLSFSRYWAWQSLPASSPESAITDRIAVTQILAVLKPKHREAIVALAETGDYELAADALGISAKAYCNLIGRARREFFALWHEHEQPSRSWRRDIRARHRERAA